MPFIQQMLRIFDLEMTTPTPYGWFHILWLLITAAATVIACIYGPKLGKKRVRQIVLVTSIVVLLLEVYKQINYTFSVGENGISADFQWYAFPFQFCSTPMYVGLLAGLTKKGKLHQAANAYLATYAVFAGIAVMLYPVTVFISTIGINIQTMVCHGSMIPIGALLLASGTVKAEHRTILRAATMFSGAVMIAVILNEVAHLTGLLATDTFNMFFISPYCEPSLPVYSLVQQHVAFPWCLLIYILAFTAAAYIMLLIPMLVFHIRRKSPLLVN